MEYGTRLMRGWLTGTTSVLWRTWRTTMRTWLRSRRSRPLCRRVPPTSRSAWPASARPSPGTSSSTGASSSCRSAPASCASSVDLSPRRVRNHNWLYYYGLARNEQARQRTGVAGHENWQRKHPKIGHLQQITLNNFDLRFLQAYLSNIFYI